VDVSYHSIKFGVDEGKKLAHRSLAGSVNIRGHEYIACPSEGEGILPHFYRNQQTSHSTQ
jgi:hypothetical protein